jgi:hypothetical protein
VLHVAESLTQSLQCLIVGSSGTHNRRSALAAGTALDPPKRTAGKANRWQIWLPRWL